MRVEQATSDQAPMLANLLELYIHDLSEVFQVDVGPDGRFGYGKLPLYWTEPPIGQAFFIKRGDAVAGFALVTRGSPASEDPQDLDVAEFFVLRAYRRSGIGRQAAMTLWDRLPGHWVVRVAEANRTGLPFWTDVIHAYTSGRCAESVHIKGLEAWRVFRFESRLVTPLE